MPVIVISDRQTIYIQYDKSQSVGFGSSARFLTSTWILPAPNASLLAMLPFFLSSI